MDFIQKIKQRAKQNIQTICLPEANDIRILRGAEIAINEDYAHIILLGNEDEIKETASSNNIDISKATIINPLKTEKLEKYENKLYELRQQKGMTIEKAHTLLTTDYNYFATMMIKMGDADGYVSGADHPTADTLRPVLQIIKGREGIKTISAFFIMCIPNKEFGEDGVFVFADCGMNENPTAEGLADIAIESAESFKELISETAEPKIAMLSYSTKGSAHSELTEKVIEGTKIANEKAPELLIDGELQVDSAIIPEIQQLKAPDSKLQGKANILVFPDLNSGNIGYKLVQRLAGAKAYGPLCQGLAKPANDLSRGCSAEDVAGVIAITAVQSISSKE